MVEFSRQTDWQGWSVEDASLEIATIFINERLKLRSGKGRLNVNLSVSVSITRIVKTQMTQKVAQDLIDNNSKLYA